ncbi:hypothetical protein Q6344_09100 [Psychrobacter cibarius]|nr:hypothetical protein Q6344_09100 [Psychrobacter cibarius]
MSFLNPVNEPVLRFKSTDAGAPQINYNARVAGDVKAVLKACLVTGYGAVTSAGWSIVNEVGSVAEFVSPSAAMSDYRLKISDSSTGTTTWSYFYQGTATSFPKGAVSKSFSSMDKASSENGWQLLVTQLGVLFVEILVNPYNNKRMARVTNWGQIKSAAASDTGANIGFWHAGVSGSANFTNDFYGYAAETYYNVGGVKTTTLSSANIVALTKTNESYGLINVDLTSDLYLYSGATLIGQQVGLLVGTVAQEVDLFGVYDDTLAGRPVLKLCLGRDDSRKDYLVKYCSVMYLHLDYWGY